MTKSVRNPKAAWGFLKADHKDAYKQLLLDEEFVNLTLVGLRHPISGQRFAFGPMVLLFGAASEVIRYNFFAMAISVLANKILGLPVLNYFDDFGALVPDIIKEIGLGAFTWFTSELGALAEDGKSEVSRMLVFWA